MTTAISNDDLIQQLTTALEFADDHFEACRLNGESYSKTTARKVREAIQRSYDFTRQSGGSQFHVGVTSSEYYVQGNQADEPCLHIGLVDYQTAERIHQAIEAAWRRDEAWRSGKPNKE